MNAEEFEKAWEKAKEKFEEDDVRAIRIIDRMGSMTINKEDDRIAIAIGMTEITIDDAEDILLSIDEFDDGYKCAVFGCYMGSDVASVLIKIGAPTHIYLEREECIEVLWKSNGVC